MYIFLSSSPTQTRARLICNRTKHEQLMHDSFGSNNNPTYFSISLELTLQWFNIHFGLESSDITNLTWAVGEA